MQSGFRETDALTLSPLPGAGTRPAYDGCETMECDSVSRHCEPSVHAMSSGAWACETSLRQSQVQSSFLVTVAFTVSPGPGANSEGLGCEGCAWRIDTSTGLHCDPSVKSYETGSRAAVTDVLRFQRQSSVRVSDASIVSPGFTAGISGRSLRFSRTLTVRGRHAGPSVHPYSSSSSAESTLISDDQVSSSFLSILAVTRSPGAGTGTTGSSQEFFTDVTVSGLHAVPCVHSSTTGATTSRVRTTTSYVQSWFFWTWSVVLTPHESHSGGTSTGDASPPQGRASHGDASVPSP